MAHISVKFHNGELVNIDSAWQRYVLVDTQAETVEVGISRNSWIRLHPQPIPSCYDADSGESFHQFEDHPTVCSECGEVVDRAHEIDFTGDSD